MWLKNLNRLVRAKVVPVLDKWADLGACDSEGYAGVAEALRRLTGSDDINRFDF